MTAGTHARDVDHGAAAATAVRRAYASTFSGRTVRELAQLQSDWVVGTFSFTLVVTFLALSAALLITFPLAIPFIVLTILTVRFFGWVDRARLRTFCDLDLAPPARPDVPGGPFHRLRIAATSRDTWRLVGYSLLRLPVGLLTLVVSLAVWCATITALLLPLTIWLLPGHRLDLFADIHLHGMVGGLAGLAIGLVLLPCAGAATHALADLDRMFARAFLGPRRDAELGARVETLQASRSRMVDAAEAERRRIERDLHDGAQQRLVALAMDLGMAKEKLATDPEAAAALLDEAHAEAKQALVELRDLARGIHPAVLTDRGLGAALSAVAARCPVPVAVPVDIDERADTTIEGIAYFVVSEALTNVARHSGATRASVSVSRRGDRLVIDVSDDGHGGADPALGTGIAGLRARVEGVDGWLFVSSPPGGPTASMAELPCGS